VHAAARRADEVFRSRVWAGRTPRERAAVLLRLAELMARDAETLARLDCEDAGKPITECRENDVPSAIESIRWFAEAVDKQYGTTTASGPDVLAFTEREPFGVVAAILPWNYRSRWRRGRSAQRSRPATASSSSPPTRRRGRCSISPPSRPRRTSRRGPAGAARRRADDGAALADDPIIGALSFTGSTATGARSSPPRRATSGESGDGRQEPADPDGRRLSFGDELIEGMVESAFLTSGQNCTAGSRILVHRSIHDEVVARFAAAAALRVGHPADPATQLGPVLTAAAARRMTDAVAQALREGATVVTGGVRSMSCPVATTSRRRW
jgi:gamma-glutamyl-gamma-aminobutyraldehyde dehydrogenase